MYSLMVSCQLLRCFEAIKSYESAPLEDTWSEYYVLMKFRKTVSEDALI